MDHPGCSRRDFQFSESWSIPAVRAEIPSLERAGQSRLFTPRFQFRQSWTILAVRTAIPSSERAGQSRLLVPRFPV
ncbi:hypothetical protein chiPu_0028608 [Chiloscyllium punctatum]|uniref:Uncharacterized protein n=1 Tax=Chiloscyllium punctatum TaxID=137246 RepID=A0A401TPG3_CHIPU|nr:hypothetical protein [Chiloscyllium punctatum]